MSFVNTKRSFSGTGGLSYRTASYGRSATSARVEQRPWARIFTSAMVVSGKRRPGSVPSVANISSFISTGVARERIIPLNRLVVSTVTMGGSGLEGTSEPGLIGNGVFRPPGN